MSIERIEIKHFKSIDSCVLKLENVNLFIGENGTGKSNVLDAVRYFFESLLVEKDDDGVYDINNKFSNEFSISITFDFTRLQKISRNNVHRNGETGYADYYDWISRQNTKEIITLYRTNVCVSRVDAENAKIMNNGRKCTVITRKGGELVELPQNENTRNIVSTSGIFSELIVELEG